MTASVVRRRRTSSARHRPLALARVQHLRLHLEDAVAERLERAGGDHLLRERAVGAGEVRGERRLELGMPPPERVGRDVGVGRAGQRARPPVDPVQLELGAELVQHRERDAAVRRQLPARDGDHPERAGREHRLALRPRGRDRAGREHADAGEARADRAERTGLQGKAGLGQDLPLLRLGRLDRAGVALEGGVGRAEQERVPPRGRRRRRASGRSGS